MTANNTRTRPYFPQLDGVRAIAALIVMGFHFCQDKNIGGVAIFGQSGVDLFFVLSGFLITTILLIAPQNDWKEIRKFYIRRALRIFPLYYGYLVIASLLGMSISLSFWLYYQNIPISMSIPVNGPNHFWTLAVEEQFYFVWPFLVLFVPRRWLGGILCLIIALSLFSRGILAKTNIEPFYFTITRLDGLSSGALLAFIYRRQWRRSRALIGLFVATVSGMLLYWHWLRYHSPSHLLLTTFYTGMIAYLISPAPLPVYRFLTSTAMRLMGKISYGLYVFHPAIFALILGKFHQISIALQAIECFSITLLVSFMSWYCFESPILLLKSKWAPEMDAPLRSGIAA